MDVLENCGCDPKVISVRDISDPLCVYPQGKLEDFASVSSDHQKCKIWKAAYDAASEEQKKAASHCICKPHSR
jgi:hypothetical protein